MDVAGEKAVVMAGEVKGGLVAEVATAVVAAGAREDSCMGRR